MASACINNIGMLPDNFLEYSPPYAWLPFGIDSPEKEAKTASIVADIVETDPEISRNDSVDFEFRLEDPVKMLAADELFSDGKLVSLVSASSTSIKSPDERNLRFLCERSSTDAYLFSPKAPRCSSRWKEILGLTKLYRNRDSKQEDLKKSCRSLKYFLHRSSKLLLNASVDLSQSLPLLKDSDSETVSLSSQFSLSSSSSGHEQDDLPQPSHDSDKSGAVTRKTATNPSKVRLAKHRSVVSTRTRVSRNTIKRAPESRVPLDSPRMNSSGKIVFHTLERSSSSPSSFNGVPKYKHRGMERSYSANIRVSPVLNVPICSLRGSSKSGVFGLPLFSTPQKKESVTGNRKRQPHCKNGHFEDNEKISRGTNS